MRDRAGHSMHDAGGQSETREMAESDRRSREEKALPYVIVLVVVFVVATLLIIATR